MLLAKVLLFSQGRIKRQNHLFKRNLSVKPSQSPLSNKRQTEIKTHFLSLTITALIYSQNQGVGWKEKITLTRFIFTLYLSL